MEFQLESCVQVPLEEKPLKDIIEKAKDWALMHGAALRSKANFSLDALQVNSMISHPVIGVIMSVLCSNSSGGSIRPVPEFPAPQGVWEVEAPTADPERAHA